MTLALTCGGCENTWSGTAKGRCHCAACHRTFSGRITFDAHRSQRGEHGSCIDPITIDLELFEGYWRRPGKEDEE